METAQIIEQFKQVLAEIKLQGLPIEQATDVAKIILQESGKFKRTEMMNNHSPKNGDSNGNGNASATDKQKEALKNFRVSFSDDITTTESS